MSFNIEHGGDGLTDADVNVADNPPFLEIVKIENFDHNWSRLLVAKSYFKEGYFDSTLVFSKGLPEIDAGQLQRLSLEGLEIKYRSPALGGIMSAIIPGSGKMYAGRLLDGIQALSIVAAPAYHAYYQL